MRSVDSRAEDDTSERNAAAMEQELACDSRPKQSLLARHTNSDSKTIEEESESLDECSEFDDFVE